MLTKSHYAARKFVKRSFRRDYRQHMCGLCHALGDGYGLASRLLTSHDVILLNLFTSAQMQSDPENIIRRCPMNPRYKVDTNQEEGSRFAAAVAVELANISVQDDIDDSRGSDLRAHFAARMLKGLHHRAQSALETLDFDPVSLNQLNAHQRIAELDDTLDPAQPTAEVSAALFVMTARLANLPENEAALAQIGASYGAYLYLSDAFRDYADDLVNGAFNPLRTHASPSGDHPIKIPQESLRLLFERLHRILANIRVSLTALTLYRYENDLGELLTEPIERLIAQVEAQRQRPAVYRQWRWQDALRAALFIMPVPEQGLVFSEAPYDEAEPAKRKRKNSEVITVGGKADTASKKKKRGQSQSTDSGCCNDSCTTHNTTWYWCFPGCDASCCDNDNDSSGLCGCLGGDSCDSPGCGDGGGCDGCSCSS